MRKQSVRMDNKCNHDDLHPHNNDYIKIGITSYYNPEVEVDDLVYHSEDNGGEIDFF